ncbi:MAG: helix-turn-helix domain-containing protein [Parvibaculaceae bacterium]|nr:helix-turn-helix domain-containing protein [Parvibaculaceae bacterium]
MSNIVSALVQKRKVGSPTRKGILMFMASCASDDGSGVWTSKATMARDLEMGKRTVQVGIDDLMNQGLISEVGTRRCAHGFTIEYRLNLAAIKALEATNPDRPKRSETTRAGDAPVQDAHPTRAGDAPQDVQEVHPNHTGTIQEPVCAADAAQHTHPAFDEFWKAYPRPKDRDGTERAFAQAVVDGADPGAIIAGAKAYAAEEKGNERQYLKHSANWLKAQGWLDHEAGSKSDGSSGDVVDLYAGLIKAGKRVFGPKLSDEVRSALMSRHGLTAEAIDAAQVAA